MLRENLFIWKDPKEVLGQSFSKVFYLPQCYDVESYVKETMRFNFILCYSLFHVLLGFGSGFMFQCMGSLIGLQGSKSP